ncbi:hypothetical protein KFE25_002120 [Diacronema lutheri]|uniref:Pseudouridine synthase n=1 Tax=Diacronema lutheri TaxID=2081491 RepID=A0A8J5XMT1_DIALT|nr:hypothetical protein KFE25_002120 [Diacronema lutheri]
MVSAVRTADGVRRVHPYTKIFKAHAKRRWLGRRVAEVMASEFAANAKPGYLQRAMADGRILLNSKPCAPSAVFRDGDVIEHRMTRNEPAVRAPLASEWILLLTNELLIIDKPATVPVHAAGRFHHNTVVAILADECDALRPAGVAGLFVMHRLDRETSGLLMLGRSASTASRIGALFRDGHIRKRYVALVDGDFPPGVHVVDAPLQREVRAGAGTNAVHPDGKPAVTEFVRLSSDAAARTSLVLCSPRTGRTHQIRLHLQWMGHPIANDALYGGSRAPMGSHNLLFVRDDAPSAERDRQDADEGDGEAGDEATAAADLESAMIFLHAVDYRHDGGVEGAWHYCAPLPPWAVHLTDGDIGGGYTSPSARAKP